MTALVGAAALGFLSWSFVEYLVHGILAHRYRTFVTPLHGTHHKDPRAVFTSPVAWVPGALAVFGAAALVAGPGIAAAFTAGMLTGFARYEYVHWRFHFRRPRSARERLLRSHHLAHHFRDARNYHGVTTRVWDRIFHTLPANCREEYALVESRPPLAGASNFAAIWQRPDTGRNRP
jgi:sterol desaturase/sphingolipid hydroxylase (fatty acid hydroxylase superfamily)